MKWLLGLLLILQLGCATVRDCSLYPDATANRCFCLKDNGDKERYNQCLKQRAELIHQEVVKHCLEKCWAPPEYCLKKCK